MHSFFYKKCHVNSPKITQICIMNTLKTMKQMKRKIFIQRNHKIIKLEYDSNVFFDDIIKSIENKYVDLDK